MEDMDPDPGVKKLRKLQYCVVSFTIFLLIHTQLPNFILLIIHRYDITKLESTFDFPCFEND